MVVAYIIGGIFKLIAGHMQAQDERENLLRLNAAGVLLFGKSEEQTVLY